MWGYVVFLFGAIAQQFILPLYKKYLGKYLREISTSCTAIFLFACAFSYWLPIDNNIIEYALVLSFILFVPFAFVFQNNFKWDKKLGELSYPIYIGHIFVMGIAYPLYEKIHMKNVICITVFNVVLSIFFAIVLNTAVGRPIEMFRKNIGANKKSLQLT